MNINKDTIHDIRLDIEKALAEVVKKHGLKSVELGSI